MNAFTYRMPAGIPGSLSRGVGNVTVEPQGMSASTPFPAYGKFGKIVGDKFVPLTTGDAASAIYGLLVRPFPYNSNTDALSVGVPPQTGGEGDCLRRGYMSVHLDLGSVVKNSPVYVRTTANGGNVVGQIEAAQEWGSASVAAGGNTGNGTFVLDVTTPVLANAIPGAYVLKFLTTTSARLTDPMGRTLADFTIGGSTGNAVTTNDQIKGVLTQGSVTFAAADLFTVTLTANTVLVPGNTAFTGPADANGMTEIEFNI